MRIPRPTEPSKWPALAMLAVSMLLLAVISLMGFMEYRAEMQAADQGQASDNIAEATDKLLFALTDAETGQRGYLLTGREEYLYPYYKAVQSVPGLLDGLRNAVVRRPDQAERANKLEPLLNAKLAELKRTVDLRRIGQTAEALAVLESDQGKAVMDQIRETCTDMVQIARARRTVFMALAQQSATQLRGVAVFGGLVLFGFLAISTFTIFRGMENREALLRQTRNSETRLSVTLASIGDAVITTDERERITFLNPAAVDLTQWTQEEAEGQPLSQVFRIVNETTQLPVESPVTKAISQGVVIGLANHTNLISKSGRVLAIDDSAAPIRTEDGKIVGAVLVFRDISQRRDQEIRIEQSAKALKASNLELQQFAYAASHDLRSPLHSVRAVADLLAHRYSDPLGAEGKELVGFIMKGVSRMTRLVSDLLAYAQSGSMEKEGPSRISMKSSLEIALSNLREEIETAGGLVTNNGTLPEVNAQETHTVQLLQNLISNSLKYHGTHAPEIQVAAERRDGYWEFAVSDNGIGIEPEYLAEVFKPFKRLHGPEIAGSGIGLATCEKIVAHYGGRIWVESTKNQGSTFRFTLPAVE